MLPIANGGTGSNSANGALNNLLPSQSGQNGKVITSNGTSAYWGASSSLVPNDNILHWDGTYSYYRPYSAYNSNSFYTSGLNLMYGGIMGENGYNFLTTQDSIKLNLEIQAKQNTLISGTNIKTINGSSVLGFGNLAINTMVYPGLGIPNSTGSAWGTSYSTSGTGNTLALTNAPTFTGTTSMTGSGNLLYVNTSSGSAIQSSSTSGLGGYFLSTNSYGIEGYSTNSSGIVGGTNGNNFGVQGQANGTGGFGVGGFSNNIAGIAGYFDSYAGSNLIVRLDSSGIPKLYFKNDGIYLSKNHSGTVTDTVATKKDVRANGGGSGGGSYIFGTGLTNTSGTVTVNTSQNISTLSKPLQYLKWTC